MGGDISVPDRKTVRIREQWYESALGADVAVVGSGSVRRKVVVHNYDRKGKLQLENKLKIFAGTLGEGGAREKTFREIRGLKEFKNIIFPMDNPEQPDPRNDNRYCIFCDLPREFVQKYCVLGKAVGRADFTLHSRVVAALNIAEVMKTVNRYFSGMISCVTPAAFYINPENGDVRVFIEYLLYYDPARVDGGEDYLLCGSGSRTLKEEDLVKFEAYTIFRLLCVDNPYDGRDTLIQIPLLSATALNQINSGKYGFIFSGYWNQYSEHIGKEAYQRWRNIPSGLRSLLEAELNRKQGEGQYKTTDEWLAYMRMLRDCLVLENGQFRLCDPDVPSQVLFLQTGDYRIPVKPRKAVYWYHVGMPEDQFENGIVAGINADGYVENYSHIQWDISKPAAAIKLESRQSIKPEEGMRIDIGGKVLYVICGGNSIQPAFDTGSLAEPLKLMEVQEVDQENDRDRQRGGGS